jgi:hypothetical protein
MRPMAPAMTVKTIIFCNANPPPCPVYRVDALPAYLLSESTSAINPRNAANARTTRSDGKRGTGPACTGTTGTGLTGTFIGGIAGTPKYPPPPPIIGGGRFIPNGPGGPFGIFASGGTCGPPPFKGGNGTPPLGLGI